MSLGPTGASFSHYFSYHHSTAFHCISLVVFFISFSLSYLLLVLLHILSTLSGDPPQFITWGIVISFPLSIPQTLIQRSLVWEGHLVRESFCYLSTWGCAYPLLLSSLGFICLCSGYVHLYICKKNEKKIKISTCVYVHSILHHWACILMFRGHFYRVCSLLGVRMWALWDPMLFVLLRHIYLWERWVTFS